MIIRPSYAKWNSIVTADTGNVLSLAHAYRGKAATALSHEAVIVVAGNKDFALVSVLTDTDITSWSTAHSAGSILCATEDDAVATVIADFRPSPLTSIGLPATVSLDFPEQASDLMKSWQVEAAPQTVEIFDLGIMNDLVGPTGICYLAGGEYRTRTSAAEGSAINFLVVDRDNVLGYFPYFGLSRSKLENLTSISGTFQVGEIIVGATSGCRAKVLAVGADYLEITFWRWDSNDRPFDFTASETITAQTSAATAVLDVNPFTEGDVLPIKPYVKDEWIEGLEVREIRPGGSKSLPQGLYFRTVLYNSHTTDPLRVKTSLILATS